MMNEIYNLLKNNKGHWLSVNDIVGCMGLNPDIERERGLVSSKAFKLFRTCSKIDRKVEGKCSYFQFKEAKK